MLLGRKRQNLNQFEEFPKEDPLLNPLSQKKLRRIKHDKKFDISEQSKLLRVSMIGTTNSGKSTLINKLLGHHVCPESMKPNTTRSNTRAIMTEDDTQVIFLDTPGVVDVELASKYKMEDSLVLDPERSCRDHAFRCAEIPRKGRAFGFLKGKLCSGQRVALSELYLLFFRCVYEQYVAYVFKPAEYIRAPFMLQDLLAKTYNDQVCIRGISIDQATNGLIGLMFDDLNVTGRYR